MAFARARRGSAQDEGPALVLRPFATVLQVIGQVVRGHARSGDRSGWSPEEMGYREIRVGESSGGSGRSERGEIHGLLSEIGSRSYKSGHAYMQNSKIAR